MKGQGQATDKVDLDHPTASGWLNLPSQRPHSMWYESDGVTLPLRAFTSTPEPDKGAFHGTVTLYPRLADGNLAGEQDDVTLTIRSEDLKTDADPSTPTIFLWFAPDKDWQRMYLTTQEDSKNADIVVDGEPLGDGRYMDAFLNGVTGQTPGVTDPDDDVEVPYRDVMISVPRGSSIDFRRYKPDGTLLDHNYGQ